MCSGIVVHMQNGDGHSGSCKAEGNILCETQGELAAVLGGEKRIVFLNGNSSFDPALCLCPVDEKKTAELNGFRLFPVCTYPEGADTDPFNAHFVPCTAERGVSE